MISVKENRTPSRRAGMILMVIACLGLSACQMVRQTANLPVNAVNAVMPGARPPGTDPALLQSELMRYADDFSGRTAVGLDDYAKHLQAPSAVAEVLSWRLAINSAVLGIVTGANPNANLMDMLALSSLVRSFVERQAKTAEPAGAMNAWLENSRVLETNAWLLAERVLTPEQQKEFRAAIDRWLTENIMIGTGFFRRPQELASGVRHREERKSQSGVFSLVGLDPTVGLDPAVREVTRSRLFAERALYAVERMPFLLRWQSELFLAQLAETRGVTNLVASTERLSQAAAILPDRITEERKAILEALQTQEGKLRELSVEIGRTLTAGEKMSTSLSVTITNFDALMKRFGVGEPSISERDTNSPPFNILDYARTAEQIAVMAEQLNALVKDTGATVDSPALEKRLGDLSDRARGDAKAVLNHAFLVGAGLLLMAFLGAVAYRWVANRMMK